MNIPDTFQATPLYRTSARGDLVAVEYLLEFNADVNAAVITQQTPLFIAAAKGHTHVVAKLLQRSDIDVNKVIGRNSSTAFLIACEWNRKEVVEMLFAKDADVNKALSDGNTGLHLAIKGGYLDLVHYLLRKNIIDREKKNIYGKTAVDIARKMNKIHPKIYTLLITK